MTGMQALMRETPVLVQANFPTNTRNKVMDSDAAPTSLGMPRNAPFEPGRAALPTGEPARAVAMDEGERGGVFARLVHDDADIAGLVAYSIYKQHKLDWLRAFEGAFGRDPEANEVASYIIGEGTPRRLATYRHLAEAVLAGRGPEIEGSPAPRHALAGRRLSAGRLGEGYTAGVLALYALIAVLFVVGFYLAMHFTATNR